MDTEFRTTNNFVASKLSSSISTNQGKLSKISNQISSGQIADNYTDIVGLTSIEGFLDNKFSESVLESKIRNNTMLLSKLGETERVLNSFSDLTMRSLKLLYQMRDPTAAPSINSEPLVKNMLDEIKVLLNASFQGQKLFAGFATGIANVVGDIVNNTNIIASVPTANYYLGDYGVSKELISGDRNISYSITAADQAFQNLIAAHHLMLSGDTSRALDIINIAKVEIGGLVTMTGTHNIAVQNQIGIDNAKLQQLKLEISEVEDVDIMKKYMELLYLQNQLKASFSIANQLKDMSLVNYIR